LSENLTVFWIVTKSYFHRLDAVKGFSHWKSIGSHLCLAPEGIKRYGDLGLTDRIATFEAKARLILWGETFLRTDFFVFWGCTVQ
jgi:hypothetical protein